MTTAAPLLQVQGLAKSFGGRAVVRDLDLRVDPGEVVGLRGPNGAGKTTILRCLLGSVAPDAGEVTLVGRPGDDRDPQVRRAVAAVLDDLAWFPDLSAAEHLELFARAHGQESPDDLVTASLQELRLEHVADQVPGTLSSGQRRRLALAATLVRPYRLILLDEPEQRLDVEGRAWLAAHLAAVAAAGRGVLLASHDDDLLARVGARVVTVVADD